MNSAAKQMMFRIKRNKRGWVFTPKDFLDLSTRQNVDFVLHRLMKQGTIRRLSRGIYDYPKQSKLFGTVPPDPDSIARALAAGDQLFPSGARTANLLGLSTQVPAKPSYLTNMTACVRQVDGQTIQLKRARVPLIDNISTHANLVVQALSYLGKNNIDDQIIDRCAHVLTNKDLAGLHHVMGRIPGWIANAIHKIEDRNHGQIHSTT